MAEPLLKDLDELYTRYLAIGEEIREIYDTDYDWPLYNNSMKIKRVHAANDDMAIDNLLKWGQPREFDSKHDLVEIKLEMIVNETSLKVIWYKGKRIRDWRQNGKD